MALGVHAGEPVIFNTFAYYCLFLLPAAALFRVAPPRVRPWVCTTFGVGFFIYFSVTQFGGWFGAACVLLFLWEAMFRSMYRPRSWTCIVGILISVAILGVFKYWNFVTGLITAPFFSTDNPLFWSGAFLPLGL